MEDKTRETLMRKKKADLIDYFTEKLHNERRTFRDIIDRKELAVKAAQKQAFDSVEEIKTAFQNLSSTIIRNYGKELDNGNFELTIPVPEGGWVTMGKKTGDKYIITAKKIE